MDLMSFVLVLVPELLPLLLPAAVKKAAAGASLQEKYIPAANTVLGMQPHRWGLTLLAAGALVTSVQQAMGSESTTTRVKCVQLVWWSAALFSDPLQVTYIYMARLPAACLDYGLRKGLQLPPLSIFVREVAFIVGAVAFEWWHHLNFRSRRLPAMADRFGGRIEEKDTKILRKYTVMFRVAETTNCSDVEQLLHQCRGHFPRPRRWDMRQVGGTRWVFFEYEDAGSKHVGTVELSFSIKRHPSRAHDYAGIGQATLKELEEIHMVSIECAATEGSDILRFKLNGRSRGSCKQAEDQLRSIASSNKRHGDPVAKVIRNGNAFARGRQAEKVLVAAGLHVEVFKFGNRGGISELIKELESSARPRRSALCDYRVVLKQQHGHPNVAFYDEISGSILEMLPNGLDVKVLSEEEDVEGQVWLEVKEIREKECRTGYVKRKNVQVVFDRSRLERQFLKILRFGVDLCSLLVPLGRPKES
mmetsp:Transcript_57852/g.102786  ORF Transcript_57852/g.102786 Transcript_57852/m.102786 type:complete len:475 (+) Transcript_57852:31-1455(+)